MATLIFFALVSATAMMFAGCQLNTGQETKSDHAFFVTVGSEMVINLNSVVAPFASVGMNHLLRAACSRVWHCSEPREVHAPRFRVHGSH